MDRQILVTATLSLLLAPLAMAQVQVDPYCDLFQQLSVGQTYYIYNINPDYPALYGPNTRCRWIARAPAGYKVDLFCNDISIPPSQNCAAGDRMPVSLTGDPNFTGGHNYCGIGTLSLVSTTNSMAIGLFSTQNSQGGRMNCQIRAVFDGSPPATSKPPPGGCDCGWRKEQRIVGGTETGINEYPFLAALIDTNERKLFCGASIIHYRYALTAAHCLLRKSDPRVLALLVGAHNYTKSGESSATNLYPLSSFTSHPMYTSQTQQHDIAIVRTQADMKFSLEVGPVCLPFAYSSTQPPEFSSVKVLGWGAQEFSGPSSTVPLAADLKVVSNQFCQSAYSGRNRIFATQICTLEDGKDACQSDSGGPVIYLDTSMRLHLVGIISYGIGCAMDFPGINTRITSYLDWIIMNSLDATYCKK